METVDCCTRKGIWKHGTSEYLPLETEGGLGPDLYTEEKISQNRISACGGSGIAAHAEFVSVPINLVSKRGKFMQKSVPSNIGGMAAILGLADEVIEKLCQDASKNKIVSAANYNSPGQVVISGHKIAVKRVINMAKEVGAKRAVLLPVSVPSHCVLMKNAAYEFSKLLNVITFKDAEIPILQNVDAKIKTSSNEIKPILLEQLYKPVRWVDTINTIHSLGVIKIIECGPGKVLCGLIKRIENSFKLFSIQDQTSLENSLV